MPIIDVPDDTHSTQQIIMVILLIIAIGMGVWGIIYITGVTYWGW